MIFGTLPDPRTPQGRLTLAIAAYHTSFVRHGDPNLERLAGSPVWPMFATDNGPTGTRAHSAPAKPSAGGVSLAFALPAAGGIRAERGCKDRRHAVHLEPPRALSSLLPTWALPFFFFFFFFFGVFCVLCFVFVFVFVLCFFLVFF